MSLIRRGKRDALNVYALKVYAARLHFGQKLTHLTWLQMLFTENISNISLIYIVLEHELWSLRNH